MGVLATRSLIYADDGGALRNIVLTVFVPFETGQNRWRCDFAFDPPIYRTTIAGLGVDSIHAFLVAISIALIFFESTELKGRAHWQGMHDCGLLSRAERPTALRPAVIPVVEGDARGLDIFATRRLGYTDDCGLGKEVVLTLYMPYRADGETWKCGFTFDTHPDAPTRYGVGVDAIEALLDALAGARAVFEQETPKGWHGSENLLDCSDFPFKIGRSFRTDSVGEPSPDTPDDGA